MCHGLDRVGGLSTTTNSANPFFNGEPSDVFVADWTNLLIGMRTSFRMEVSRVSGDAFENLQIHVRAYLRADVQLAHPEAFVVLS